MLLISFVLGKVGRWIALGLALLAGLAEVFRRGRKSGIEKMKREQEAARAKAIAQRKALDDELANIWAADLDQRFKRWVRNDEAR